MEDSFRVRVDKVFGPLLAAAASSSSSSSSSSSTTTTTTTTNNTPSSLSSLWTLSDDEIDKKEWNRDRDDVDDPHSPSKPYPSHLDGFFSNHTPPPPLPPTTTTLPLPISADFGQQLYSDLQQLDDHQHDYDFDNNNHHKKINKPDDPHHQDQDDWDIRSSIGLDCTLDYEEEEDEYDKVAVGREKAGDRLYMRDMVDYGIDVDAHTQLPNSFTEAAARDPRANHVAAKLRLREDAEAAGNFDSLKLSDIYVPSAINAESKILENVVIPKPILKKRIKTMDEKSPKRVRFHQQSSVATYLAVGSRSMDETSSREQAFNMPHKGSLALEAKAANEVSCLPQNSSSNEEAAVLEDASGMPEVPICLPDYLRNPRRYTRYDLDSSNDMDEESNRKACAEFLNQLKKPTTAESQLDIASVSFHHPLAFTPKKKQHDSSLVKANEFKQNQGEVVKDKTFRVGIAAGDSQDGEACAMEEADRVETVVGKSSQKPGRRYRTRNRTNVEPDDHVT